MTTRTDEPYHRQWLHAMEDDLTVPGTAMQVGRIVADYAASRGGETASVTFSTLQRQTHRSRPTIDEAITYLTNHGWLVPQPRKNGQRALYSLTFGRPGERRKPVRKAVTGSVAEPVTARPAARDQFSSQTGSQGTNRFSSQTAAGSATEPRPVQPPNQERLTSVTSLSKGNSALHAALISVVPDATERETQLVLEEIKSRPGVRSARAVLQAEIKHGGGPELVALVRGKVQATQQTRLPLCGQCDNGWIEDDQGRVRRCPDCGTPRSTPVAVLRE